MQVRLGARDGPYHRDRRRCLHERASALVRVHGDSGWTGCLIPLTVDGLIYASSIVILDRYW